MKKRFATLIASLTIASSVQAETITTLGAASIYGTGFYGSIAAQEFALGSYEAGSAVVLSDVFGEVDCCLSDSYFVGADGGDFDLMPEGHAPWGGNTDVNAANGLSGIRVAESQLFLAGAFIDSSTYSTSGTPAPDSDFSASSLSFTAFAPLLNQVFFMGDGLTGTGTGTQQLFYIPEWADTLLIGFVDAPEFEGDPNYYADNSGSITATFDVIAPTIPLPAGLPLLLSAFGLAGFAVRRRKS
ncbi:hypothetical protein A9Q95_10480 [Rhodobacterales bacterium 59_46_T64]|nr:hypothetical protein A9Q95_10480 [Rhodobacterales bacterium 59_46_T64]